MIKNILLIILLNLTCINAFAQEFKEIKKENISVKYPIDWTVKDLKGHILYFHQPEDKNLDVVSFSTFGIRVSQNSNSINQISKNYESYLSTNEKLKDLKIASKNKTEFKGFSAVEYHITYTSGHLPQELIALIFTKDDKAYLLEATTYWFKPHMKKTDFEVPKEMTKIFFENLDIN